MKKIGFFISGIMTVLMMTLPGQTLLAHEGATGVVKDRMQLMKAMGKRMRTMRAMAEGKIAMDTDKVTELAKEIANKSDHLQGMFPPGSLHGESEALPIIWDQWEDFLDKLAQLQQEAERLQQAAVASEAESVSKQIAAVGKSCGGCHKTYRKKDD